MWVCDGVLGWVLVIGGVVWHDEEMGIKRFLYGVHQVNWIWISVCLFVFLS